MFATILSKNIGKFLFLQSYHILQLVYVMNSIHAYSVYTCSNVNK